MSDKLEIIQGGPFSLREVITKEFEGFFESILEQNALTPEQQTALGETIKTSIEKRDQVGAFLARIDSEAEALKREEARLAARRKSFERIAEIFTESLHAQMREWGITRAEGQRYAFLIKRNPPSVEITDEAAIPAEFWDYTPQLKKAEIKDALSAGKEVEGAKLDKSKTRLEVK